MPSEHSTTARRAFCGAFRRTCAKEVRLFFASPIAYLFIAAFLAITLFVFFWGEAFFARNIADINPVFEWMPLLLIFLASALTMRLWSDERRNGTLEHILTQPAPLAAFVCGKFAACMLLLAVALLLTLPLPITVAILGNLDWGPVFAGYLATLLLGGAYLAMGLFVSARCETPIVSLLCSVALCAVFYLPGSALLSSFFDGNTLSWMRWLGTGSRFDSITRGVLDLRDLYYYLSLIAIFIWLNTFTLDRSRRSNKNTKTRPRQRLAMTLTVVVIANIAAANLWLSQLTSVRADVTQGQIYTLSKASRHYLSQLQEPLVIRAYLSSKTHPLLAPLVPQLKNLLKEYSIAGGRKVHVEFLDPTEDPKAEKSAVQKYGLQPMRLPVVSRYQTSVVNSYFNIVISYGDQFQTLGFEDLAEMKSNNDQMPDIELRNPEHDITQAIRKTMNAYRSQGNLFSTVSDTLTFTGYVSADNKLPEALKSFRKQVESTLAEEAKNADGRLKTQFIDPQANGGAVADRIGNDYGFEPMRSNQTGSQPFYFYMTLTDGSQVMQIPLGNFKQAQFKRNLESAIKRFAHGFTKTVTLVTPVPMSQYAAYTYQGPRFDALEKRLNQELNVRRSDLSSGKVPGNTDLLLLVAPEHLGDKALFAIDQYLMQGGTVIALASPNNVEIGRSGLQVHAVSGGLEQWLAHNGLSMKPAMVLDPQATSLLLPVKRNINGFQQQELRTLQYPYLPQLRGDELNREHPVTASLPGLSMAWASPIEVDKQATDKAKRKITELLHSSANSWLSDSRNVTPRVNRDGESTFQPEGARSSYLLGVIASGRFDSYFAGKPSPLLAGDNNSKHNKGDKKAVVSGVIQHSSPKARLMLLSSNDFTSDQVLQMTDINGANLSSGALELVQNAVDWALEDPALLSIRSRGHFNRTLEPLPHTAQLMWEYGNYLVAAVLLIALMLLARQLRLRREARYLQRYLPENMEGAE